MPVFLGGMLSTALLEQYDERRYGVRIRLVLKRRLHQGSIERLTGLPGSLSTEWVGMNSRPSSSSLTTRQSMGWTFRLRVDP
jgi:hypothetical protein